jgi:hypothetical protein
VTYLVALSSSTTVGTGGRVGAGGGWQWRWSTTVVVGKKAGDVTVESRPTAFGEQRPAGGRVSLLCHQFHGNKCQRGSIGYSVCLHVPLTSGVQSLYYAFFFHLYIYIIRVLH